MRSSRKWRGLALLGGGHTDHEKMEEVAPVNRRRYCDSGQRNMFICEGNSLGGTGSKGETSQGEPSEAQCL
jgi:hypothetical protein